MGLILIYIFFSRRFPPGFLLWGRHLFQYVMYLGATQRTPPNVLSKKSGRPTNGNHIGCGPNANKFKYTENLEIDIPFCANISHIYKKKKNTETRSLDNVFYTTYFYTKKRYLCMGLHIYFI